MTHIRSAIQAVLSFVVMTLNPYNEKVWILVKSEKEGNAAGWLDIEAAIVVMRDIWRGSNRLSGSIPI